MMSYRFRRRAFLGALSGGAGLKIMLRTLEGRAQSMKSPPRLLVTHWPVGIVAGSSDALLKPTSGSVGGSQALKPFADAGLGADMTVFRGISTPVSYGGGHEGGMVSLLTGVAPGGVRSGEQESDDAFSAGPSFDQVMLKYAPALQRPGTGFANSVADSRTDFGEISAKCMSYSYKTQNVGSVLGATVENVPLMGEISPLAQFMNLFSGFVPTGSGGAGGGGGAGGSGGASQPVADALLKNLVGRRSVLDFSIEELNQVKKLAPSGVRNKLSIHTDAVLAAESAVAKAITDYPKAPGSGGAGGAGGPNIDPSCGATCAAQPVPPPNVVGKPDPAKGDGNYFGNPVAKQDDAPIHAQVGALHFEVLKAAFVCDLIRVGTYQWASANSHVGFALYPGSTTPYMHHPESHTIYTGDTTAATTLAALKPACQFLFAVHSWYFARHAENLTIWKNTVDGCGNSLLDFTVVPFLTEVTSVGHERTNMLGMIIGGKKLGFVHNQYVTTKMPINQVWGTIAQAYGVPSTVAPLGAPVAGLWNAPS